MCVKRSERRLAETYEQLRRGNVKPDIHSDLARSVPILLVKSEVVFIELLQLREYALTSDSLCFFDPLIVQKIFTHSGLGISFPL